LQQRGRDRTGRGAPHRQRVRGRLGRCAWASPGASQTRSVEGRPLAAASRGRMQRGTSTAPSASAVRNGPVLSLGLALSGLEERWRWRSESEDVRRMATRGEAAHSWPGDGCSSEAETVPGVVLRTVSGSEDDAAGTWTSPWASQTRSVQGRPKASQGRVQRGTSASPSASTMRSATVKLQGHR
jgi:hypothetical protein